MTDAASLTLATDRTIIAKGERTKLYLVLATRATGVPVETERPSLRVMFALDASGSMQGPPIEQALRSVEAMLEILGARDAAGLVAFSDEATEVAPLLPIADARRTLRGRLARVTAEGSTHIAAGLERAVSALGARPSGARNIVLLLSDGAPNVGPATPEALGELARRTRAVASCSTLGYGPEHHEDVLAAIADGGGGAYRYVADPATAAVEFGAALGAQADVVADRVELVVTPAPGVEIARVLGRRPVRISGRGLHVAMPDLLDRAEQLAVLELEVEAAREGGAMPLVGVGLRFHAAESGAACETHAQLAVDVASTAGPVVPEAEAQALCVACDDVRADARAMADRGQWEGAAAVVRQHLARIAAATAYHAGDGSPLSEAYEQLLDEAMAYERRPAQEQYSAFRKANRGVSIAVSSQLYGARGSRGPRALDVEADLAGAFPHAHLELLDGPHAGRRHALGADNVLGRTSDADIALESGSVSRRHARIFAHEGRFWLADLGSTNRTTHNGVALGREHVRLASGDRIEVGSVALAYVEG